MWDQFYNELKQMKETKGTIEIFTNDEKTNWWISGQRFLKKHDKLPKDKIKLLDDIGFTWSPSDSSGTSDNSDKNKKKKV
jgi:hypothetical protein